MGYKAILAKAKAKVTSHSLSLGGDKPLGLFLQNKSD